MSNLGRKYIETAQVRGILRITIFDHNLFYHGNNFGVFLEHTLYEKVVVVICLVDKSTVGMLTEIFFIVEVIPNLHNDIVNRFVENR